jgi:predicted nucleic acid-binding protein
MRPTTVRFVDTNVLLYSISNDPLETDKAERATTLLHDRDLAVSVQVLQEFYVQATRASRPDPLTHDQAAGLVISFMRFAVQETSRQLVVATMTAKEQFNISYWDAAIIEAARFAGCDVVLSEDLSDGSDYGGIRVENPFSGS